MEIIISWKKKLFSKKGKEVLLKAIIQAIPTYPMTCSQISTFLCNQLDILMALLWCNLLDKGKKNPLEELKIHAHV